MTDKEKIMTDREKVLAGLECCHTMLHNLGVQNADCKRCPYNKGHSDGTDNPVYCVANLADDAYELLKPRVLGLDEMHRGITVWLEDIDKQDVMLAIGGSSAVGHKCFIDVLDRSLSVSDAEYNIRWRAWTAEPTTDQMKSTPWSNS